MAGRPPAARSISNNVLAVANLQLLDVIPKEIYLATTDSRTWLQWLAEHRLIRNSNTCGRCQGAMTLCRRQQANQGYTWRCRPCGVETSVHTGSFMSNCQMPTEKIVMMMFYWIHAVKCTHVKMFEEIDDWHVIVNYNNYFRVECEKWLNGHHVQLGGFDANGASVVVEVDETFFFHRKYHRGRRRKGSWVFGIVERVSGKCWLEVVPRRDAATLEQIILAHVLPGTTIMSDAWGGYANINQLNNGVYRHEVVVHAHNFVDPVHGDIHTQSIEGLWMQVKRKLRYQSGTSRELFKSYLSEFQWRHSHKQHTFGEFLGMLSQNYHI